MQLESALEKLQQDCQQAIEDSRNKLTEDRQALLVAEEEQVLNRAFVGQLCM
jgi:hypothetical protein